MVSFFAGLGVAGGFAIFQLRQDIWESHKLLSEQVGQIITFHESQIFLGIVREG